MSCRAFLAYLPTVTQTNLREVQHLVQGFGVDARLIPFSANLANDVEDAFAVIVVMPWAQSLRLFWWDPHYVAQLSDEGDDRLYESLAHGCMDFFSWPCE
jgi:hypothetical protein